jgi:hypothetical protein
MPNTESSVSEKTSSRQVVNGGNPYNGWTSTDPGEAVLAAYYRRSDTLFVVSGVFRY